MNMMGWITQVVVEKKSVEQKWAWRVSISQVVVEKKSVEQNEHDAFEFLKL
jgi:hypothetical protein